MFYYISLGGVYLGGGGLSDHVRYEYHFYHRHCFIHIDAVKFYLIVNNIALQFPQYFYSNSTTGCLIKFAIIRGTVHCFLPFSFVFDGCLTRHLINATRIVLFKSTIKLNNSSSGTNTACNRHVDLQ